MTEKVIFKELSYVIVGVLFEVYNELGYGYQEKYYERAIEQEFERRKVKFKRQPACNIVFKGEKIGKYYFDFLIEDLVVLEIKQGNYFFSEKYQSGKRLLESSKSSVGYSRKFYTKWN